MQAKTVRVEAERGMAAISLLILLLPLVLVVGAYLRSMSARNSRLSTEVESERSLLGCESGLDAALFRARLGTMHNGDIYEDKLPGGTWYTARADYLRADHISNDGDSDIDEPDEDVFRITVDGWHGTAHRRIAAYLGFTSYFSPPGAAITTYGVPGDLSIVGAANIDGRNHSLSGGLTGSGDVKGLTAMAPGTTADLLARLTTTERSKALGSGGAPSVGVAPASSPDINELVAQARNTAQIVITSSMVTSTTYGNPTTGPQYIVFRDGDVKMAGNTSGAGLLVVTGSLTLAGNFTWTGLVVVLGDVHAATGTSRINGALLMGPASTTLDMKGTADIWYSSAGLDLVRRLSGRYVAYNGWQEISAR